MPEKIANTGDEVQLVVFTAGKEEFGLEVNQVQEIVRLLPIARVPRAAAFIEGVVNLRGNVVPVINLHYRLGLEERRNTDQTRIIVTEVEGIFVGLVVDAVIEVLYLSRSILEPPAVVGSVDSSKFLKGIGKLENRLLLLLDLAALLDLEQQRELT